MRSSHSMDVATAWARRWQRLAIFEAAVLVLAFALWAL
jgi:hypothetical protein